MKTATLGDSTMNDWLSRLLSLRIRRGLRHESFRRKSFGVSFVFLALFLPLGLGRRKGSHPRRSLSSRPVRARSAVRREQAGGREYGKRQILILARRNMKIDRYENRISCV